MADEPTYPLNCCAQRSLEDRRFESPEERPRVTDMGAGEDGS